MEEKIKRPPSVRIAQILLMANVVILLLYTSLRLIPLLSGSKFPWLIALFSLINLSLVVIYLAAYSGVSSRKIYGRWLAVILFSLNCAYSVYVFARIAIDETYQSKLMSRTTAVAFGSIVISLMLFLVCRLAFGSAANAFFAKPTPDE